MLNNIVTNNLTQEEEKKYKEWKQGKQAKQAKHEHTDFVTAFTKKC